MNSTLGSVVPLAIFLTRTLYFVKGEQVDLSSFAPACLPALNQSFAGSTGTVAGENSKVF